MTLHDFNARKRLKRAQQYTLPDPLASTGHIQHEVIAVDEIHIGMAARQVQRSVACRGPIEGVACGVVREIGLRLDDAPEDPGVRQFPHQRLANEIAREGPRGGWELTAVQQFNGLS